jgi:serine/threonine protein kinase
VGVYRWSESFRRYTLVKILGQGGMGVVWLARDEELERDVALKFLPQAVVHERALLDDLKHESAAVLSLRTRTSCGFTISCTTSAWRASRWNTWTGKRFRICAPKKLVRTDRLFPRARGKALTLAELNSVSLLLTDRQTV